MINSSIHPGKVLLEELLERDWTLSELASKLSIERDHLRDFLLGMEGLNEDLAERIGGLVETGSAYWLNLQANYDQSLPIVAETVSAK